MKPRRAPIARSRMKRSNRRRRAREFARAYGSTARVAWIKTLPCVACGQGPCENSHVRSRSGLGRKGDARQVVPMCAPDHRLYGDPAAFAAAHPDLDLNSEAARVAALWETLNT